MSRLAGFAAVILTLAVGACGGSPSTSQAGAPARRSSTLLITAEEIAGTGTVNVYDAILRLRPQWLTSSRTRRGGSGDPLQVYLDDNRYGTMESLRQLSIGGVQQVQYMSASDATNRYGTGHTGGAIRVIMAKQ